MRALLVAVLTALVFPTAVLAAPGDLDTSFHAGGKATIAFGPGPSAALDMLATTEEIALAGFGKSDGGKSYTEAAFALRTSGAGEVQGAPMVLIDRGRSSRFTALARQPQSGGYVAVGWEENASGGSHIIVARFSPLGVQDMAFGGDGVMEIVPGAGDARAEAVTVDGQDRIYVAGYHDADGTDAVDRSTWLVARLTATGAEDPSGAGFGGSGTFMTSLSNVSEARDAVPREIVFVGDGFAIAGGENGGIDSGAYRLDRITMDGIPVNGFDGDGRATFDHLGGYGVFNSLVQLADGSFIAGAGRSNQSGSRRDWHLMKISGTGQVQMASSYQLGTFSEITDLTLEGDSILAAGYVDSNFGVGKFNATTFAPDPAFGVKTTDFGNTETPLSFDYTERGDVATAISLVGPDRVLAAGAGGSPRSAALARYRLDAGSSNTGGNDGHTGGNTSTGGTTTTTPPPAPPTGGSAGLTGTAPLPESGPVFASFVRTPRLTRAQVEKEIAQLRDRGVNISVEWVAREWRNLTETLLKTIKPGEVITEQTLAPSFQGMRTSATNPLRLQITYYNPLENCGANYSLYEQAMKPALGKPIVEAARIVLGERFRLCRVVVKREQKKTFEGKKVTEDILAFRSVGKDAAGPFLSLTIYEKKVVAANPPLPCPVDRIAKQLKGMPWDGWPGVEGAEELVKREKGANALCAFDVQYREDSSAPYRFVSNVKTDRADGRPTITVNEPKTSLAIWVGTHSGGGTRMPLLWGWQMLEQQRFTLGLRATDLGVTVGSDGQRREHLAGVRFDAYFDPTGGGDARSLGSVVSGPTGEAEMLVDLPRTGQTKGTVRIEASWSGAGGEPGLGGWTTMRVAPEANSNCAETMNGMPFSDRGGDVYQTSFIQSTGNNVEAPCRGASAGDWPSGKDHFVASWQQLTGRKLTEYPNLGGGGKVANPKRFPALRDGSISLWQGAIGAPLSPTPDPPRIVSGPVLLSNGFQATSSRLQDFGPDRTAIVIGERANSVRGGFLGIAGYAIAMNAVSTLSNLNAKVIRIGKGKSVLPDGGVAVAPAEPGTTVASGTVAGDPTAPGQLTPSNDNDLIECVRNPSRCKVS